MRFQPSMSQLMILQYRPAHEALSTFCAIKLCMVGFFWLDVLEHLSFHFGVEVKVLCVLVEKFFGAKTSFGDSTVRYSAMKWSIVPLDVVISYLCVEKALMKIETARFGAFEWSQAVILP